MGNVLAVAHRGFSYIYPENTILSFEKAALAGVDFIELDVRETIDGKIVVFHDASAERTTGVKGNISEMTWDEIKQLDAGKWKGYDNVRVPLLEEVMEAMKGRTRILVEIKEASVSGIISIVKRFVMEDDVIIGSFRIGHLEETRALSPRISTALISSGFPEKPGLLLEEGIPILDLGYRRMDINVASLFISRGISLGVWTVDDETDMKNMLALPITFLTTNRPDLLLRLQGR